MKSKALHIAAENGHEGVVRALLAAKARVDCRNQVRTEGEGGRAGGASASQGRPEPPLPNPSPGRRARAPARPTPSKRPGPGLLRRLLATAAGPGPSNIYDEYVLRANCIL